MDCPKFGGAGHLSKVHVSKLDVNRVNDIDALPRTPESYD